MARVPSSSPGPRPRWHRPAKVVAVLTLLAVVVVAALPRLMGLAPARAWLVGRINARLAPGSIGLAGLAPTWTGPIELTGVTLVDPKGKKVLAARRVRLDRGLLGLLASPSKFGKVVVEGAEIDVERRADGSVDVLDALGPLAKPAAPGAAVPGPAPASAPADPGPSVVVVVVDGKLRLVSPELGEPLVAGSIEGKVTLAPGRPIEVALALADAGRSLEVRAKLDNQAPPGTPGDLELAVAGKSWPLHVRRSGADVRGRFDGTLEANRRAGMWSAKGESTLAGVVAEGPALSGDRLTLDRVALACDAGQAGDGWAVRRFELTSPVAHLRAIGVIPAPEGVPAQLRGEADLAALARMLPHAMRIREGLSIDRGTADVRVDLSARGGAERIDLVATVANLVASEAGKAFTVRETPTITASAARSGGRVTVEKAEIKAAGVDVAGGGDLDSGVTLKGTVDLAALHAQLRDLLDLGGLSFSGHARLAADYRRHGETFKARLVADGRDLDVVGATSAPIHRDTARVDAWVAGPAKADGTPADWGSARLDLKAGDLALDLAANARNGEVAVAGVVAADVASPAPGRASAKVALRRKGRVYEIEDLRVGLHPADAAGTVRLAARGRVDLDSGEVTLAAIPGVPPGALGLGADGLKVSGLGQPGRPLKVDAALLGDLGALDLLVASWTGSAPKGLAGAWSSRLVGSKAAAGRVDVDGRLDLAELAGNPAVLAVRAAYLPDVDRLDLAALDLSTGHGRVVVRGQVAEARGRRLAEIRGTIDPRWDVIGPILAKSAGPDARAQATFRPFHLAGSLAGETRAAVLAQVSGEVGLDLASARASGVVVGPAAVVLHFGGGLARFDPVVTTVNGGPTLIQANLGLDDADGLWLRLDASRIDGAAINDAVSDALLAYVAPVLSRATEVNGKLTVVLPDKGASLPLTATGSTRLDGLIAFQDVQFRPGPLGAQVLSLTGRPAPRLAIGQPVQLQVADGRVRTSGLSIPIAANAKVDFSGSVGFDKTLDCKAIIPLTAGMLGRDPALEKLVAGKSVTLPIGGTLARPAIDRRAFQVALRETARALVGSELESEAGRFLDRVAGPNPDGKGAKANPGRDAVRGLLEGLGREVGPKKP